MSEEKTIFQKIIDKEIHSINQYQDDLCIAIEDINPKAPIHLLIIPKKPIPKLSEASEEDVSILGHLMFIVGEMSRKFETEDSFNVVINNGASAGQTVFHLHLHLLAGRDFSDLFPALSGLSLLGFCSLINFFHPCAVTFT